jgi:vacuolar-type H+-ATPase subunit E/Vma4
MATVTKDFKVKNGLIVEGTTGSINNFDILTKKTDDQNYIVNLIGGTATSANEANKVVKRDASGNFAANEITADLIGDVTGNADTATALETSRTIELTGDVTGSVSFNGTANVQISTTLDGSFATDAEVATAKGEAISDAASDATTKANAAQAAAELTASNALSSAVSTLEDQIADAETNANTYTNNAITALNLAGTYDALGAASQALSDANDYTDDKISDLVDSAPALLDTLNELAAAIADNPNYATDVANLVATKADTSYVNQEISDLDTAAQGYASTAQSNAESFATTAANNAQDAAEDYADNLAVNYDAAGSAAAAQTAAQSYADGLDSATNTRINNLDTDDVAEGSNLYYTTARAKTDAAALLTSATLTNIQITGNGSGLTITAENGVADSDTDDLVEGTSNLYFTNARAVSALEAVTPDFPAVELASVAKQVAASALVSTASTSTAVSWAKSAYRSAEFLVKIANGSHTEISKVILTLDTSDNVAITEYAMVGTNGDLGSVTADVNGSDVRLRVATINNDSTVSVVGTLLV